MSAELFRATKPTRGARVVTSWRLFSLSPACGGEGAAVLSLAAILAAVTSTAVLAQAPGPPTDDEILALMKAHCVMCHGAEPTHPAFARAPAGILLEAIPQVAANAERIMAQVVVNRAMPLGNETGMTGEERNRIAAWIEGRRK